MKKMLLYYFFIVFTFLCFIKTIISTQGVSFTPIQVAQSFTSLAYLKGKNCATSKSACDLTPKFIGSGGNSAVVELSPNVLNNWGTASDNTKVSINANGVIIFAKKLDNQNNQADTLGINYPRVFGEVTTTVPCICSANAVTKWQSRLSILECFFSYDEFKKMLINPANQALEGRIYYQRNWAMSKSGDTVNDGGSTIISWENLFLDRGSTNTSSFQVEIFDNGNIRVSYGNVSLTSGEKCAVGYEDTQYVTFVNGVVIDYYGFPVPISGCGIDGLCKDISSNSGFFFCKFFACLLLLALIISVVFFSPMVKFFSVIVLVISNSFLSEFLLPSPI